MQTEQELRFGPYRLDLDNRQLWRGTQAVKLTPKALAVLRQLVQQSGQVVSKEELFQTVWADTVVSDAALTFCIQELRRALRDDAKEPRYIETVHRRGFRFIAPLTTAPLQGPGVGAQGSVRELGNEVTRRPEHAMSAPNPGPRTPSPVLVGRTAELTQLHGWLDKALQGERQLVFVTGEPGIGKTTLSKPFFESTSKSRVQSCKKTVQKSHIETDPSPTPSP